MKIHVIDRENKDRKDVAALGEHTYCGIRIKNSVGQVVRPLVHQNSITLRTAKNKDLSDRRTYCQRCKKASRL